MHVYMNVSLHDLEKLIQLYEYKDLLSPKFDKLALEEVSKLRLIQ